MNQSATACKSLPFAKSSSQMVGAQGEMVRCVRDHADQVYGTVNMMGDVAFAVLSVSMGMISGPWYMAALGLYLASNIPMLLSGKGKCDSLQDANDKPIDPNKSSWEKFKEDAAKPFNPVKHPVESSAGMNFLAGAIFAGMGIGEIMAGQSAGALLTLFGLIEMPTRLLEIFGDDKAEIAARKKAEAKSQSLKFNSSSHQVVGPKSLWTRTTEWMEENAEMVAGVSSIASSVAMIGYGIMKDNPAYWVAGALYFASYSIYTLFVRREQEHESPDAKPSFAERVGKRHAPEHRAPRKAESFVERVQQSSDSEALQSR